MNPNTRENYLHLKNKKLKEQVGKVPIEKISTLFNGMVFYINGMTDPPPFKLQRLIQTNGGEYCVSRFQRFTHVISLSLSKSSLNSYRNYPVLRPEWLVDCIESKKLLSMESYRLNRIQDSSAISIKTMFPSATPSSNVEQYFEKSRLHHLSTLKNYFKKICLENFNKMNTRKDKLNTKNPKMIAHFDMDCFFVAVSIADRPELRDYPVVVTHANQQNQNSTSSVSSSNYVARKYGITNGMYVKNAYKLCPNLVCVPYNFELIKVVAEKFIQILCNHFTLVYPLSCDEALVDITQEFDSETIKTKIEKVREAVLEATNCSCSAGCSSSSELCKILLKQAKPNGARILYPQDNINFIGKNIGIYQLKICVENLKINELQFLDENNKKLLDELNYKTLKDIKHLTKVYASGPIEGALGKKLTWKLVQFSKGCFDDDNQNLIQKLITPKKSVSVNYNFGIRFNEKKQLDQLLESLCNELYSRMIREDINPILLTLKLMVRNPNAPIETYKRGGHGACDVLSSSVKIYSGLAAVTNTFLLLKSQEVYKKIQNFNVTDLRGVSLSLKNNLHNPSTPNSQPNTIIQSFFQPRMGSFCRSSQPKLINETPSKIKSDIATVNKITPLSITELIQNKALSTMIRRRFLSVLSSGLAIANDKFDHELIKVIMEDLDIIVQSELYSLLFIFQNILERYKDKLEPNTYTILKLAIDDRIDLYRSNRK